MAYDPEQNWKEEFRNRPRSRYARIALALGVLACIDVTVATPFDQTADPKGWYNILPMSVPILVGLYLSPFARDMWLDRDNAKYDEFENAVLSNATRQGYFMLLAFGAGIAIWGWAGSLYQIPRPLRPYDWSAVFIAFCLLGSALPVLIAELYVPFPPDEMDDD